MKTYTLHSPSRPHFAKASVIAKSAARSNKPARASGTKNEEPRTKDGLPKCPCCQQPMVIIARILPGWKHGALWQAGQSRAPPKQPQGASRA